MPDKGELDQLKRLALFGSVTGRAIAFVELENRYPGFIEKLEDLIKGVYNVKRG
jgi:hypothetical protein